MNNHKTDQQQGGDDQGQYDKIPLFSCKGTHCILLLFMNTSWIDFHKKGYSKIDSGLGVLFLLLHPLLSVAGHACPATLYLKIPAPTESPVSALQLPTWY